MSASYRLYEAPDAGRSLQVVSQPAARRSLDCDASQRCDGGGGGGGSGSGSGSGGGGGALSVRMRASASDLGSRRSSGERGGGPWTTPRRHQLSVVGFGGGASAARSPVAESGSVLAEAPSRSELAAAESHRHESILSDIGAEYLRSAGAVGRFKQLQRLQVADWQRDGGGGGGKNSTSPAGGKDDAVVQLSDLPRNGAVVADGNGAATGSAEIDDAALSKSVGNYRLGRKKVLNERRRTVADLCLGLAVFGIALMIAETECNLNGFYNKDEIYSLIVKSLISFSTGILLICTAMYHVVDLQLYLLNNCLEDWRIVVSAARVSLVLAELLVCILHPPPGTGYMTIAVFNRGTRHWDESLVPIDVALSLPMFARLYLVVRGLLLHSKLFNDTSSRTIGALNKIKFDARFIIKTLMTICPGTVLAVVLVTVWLLAAWMVRFCESYHDDVFINYFTAVYMIIITFLSVGYGDIVPITYCGRGISMASGLVGAGCMALLVAVIANKLELTRAEKLVHSFMMDSQLSKQLKDAAANVLRETWMLYKHTRLVERINARVVRTHQRKFLAAIQRLRKVKGQQRKAHDDAIAMMDQGKIQSSVYDGVCELKQQQIKLQSTLTGVETSLQALELQIKCLQPALQQWMKDHQMSSIYLSMPDVALQEDQQFRTLSAGLAPPATVGHDRVASGS